MSSIFVTGLYIRAHLCYNGKKSERGMAMKVRLCDIAEKTGFSINTVSHALRDLPDISEATKAIIRRAAEELDYIPDLQAGSFKSGKRGVISVILPDIVNPHFTLLFHEAETYFQKLGITTFFMNTGENAQDELKAVRASIGQNVDGIILCPTVGDDAALGLLSRSHTPYVLVGRHAGEQHRAVITDDEAGGYLATKHLLSLGHRRIACVRTNGAISSDRERYNGYRRALAEAGIVPDESDTLRLSLRGQQNGAAITEFLKKNRACHAIFAFSDLLATEIIAIAAALGIRVPEELSVVGFDRIGDAYPQPLPLTTVGTVGDTLGLAAAECLHRRIEGKQDSEALITLPVALHLGKTAAP